MLNWKVWFRQNQLEIYSQYLTFFIIVLMQVLNGSDCLTKGEKDSMLHPGE